MVDYFYRSKKDPADTGDEMLKKELSAGINRILSFIRQQEKDFLLPVGTLKTQSVREMEILEALGKHLLQESEKAATLFKQSDFIAKALKHLLSIQKEKDVLKKAVY
jgi:hypothetical protein